MDQKHYMWRFIPSISPTNGRYASAFGPRIHPVTGEVGKMHQGVDIANERWTPIYAPADGVVEVAQLSSTFGNFVTIDHGNGIKTRYGHMQLSIVHPGQYLHRYQVIGYMGNTGRSVGPHLHYEVWVRNSPVNPLAYMLPNGYTVD
jgi:murein DD-endopeptidase MepM/ murein hydrolase activator NlpD